MEDIINLDRQFFLYLNNLGSAPFDQFWIMVSEIWVWVPFYFILAYLLFRNFRLKSVIFIIIFIALGVTVSDQLAGIFKTGIARLRPCHDPALQPLMRSVKCGGQFGFYSGHASNSFFIAAFISSLLGRKFRALPFVMFSWAALVAFSRIYLGVHFPLDILMGTSVGFILGNIFAILSKNVIRKQKILGENQSL